MKNATEKTGNAILWLGGLVTVFYVFLIGLIRPDLLSLNAIRSLRLNELGDLLAGIFGPVSFLWLILGFWMQKFELRQNSIALKQQAKELANQVAQHQQLVAVSKSELEITRSKLEEERIEKLERIKPKIRISEFYFMKSSGSQGYYRAELTNENETAVGLELELFDSPTIRMIKPGPFVGTLKRGATKEVVVLLTSVESMFSRGKANMEVFSNFSIRIKCADESGEIIETVFKFEYVSQHDFYKVIGRP